MIQKRDDVGSNGRMSAGTWAGCWVASLMLGILTAAAMGADVPASKPAVGVPVEYQLPTEGPLPRTYRVTLAIVDAKDPNWIVSTFVAGEPRTVTSENRGRFTESWDGLDENCMPVPAGEYGVKGIFMPATKWSIDDKYHTLIAKLHGGPFSWLPGRDQDNQERQVHGDPVGSPPGDIATAGDKAVFQWVYLENGTNYFLVDLKAKIGLDQILQGFGSGGAAGGIWTATDGQTVWAWCTDGGIPFVFRTDAKPFGTGKARFRDKVYLPEGWVTGLAAWREPASGRTLVYLSERGKMDFGSAPANRKGQVPGIESKTERVNVVRVLDADGKTVGQLDVAEPQALTVRDGKLYVIHRAGDASEILIVPLVNGLPTKDNHTAIKIDGVAKPEDIDVDSQGRIYLCDSEANQVCRLDEKGHVAMTFGKAGAQKPGHYDPQIFMAPGRIATWKDAQGADRLIVMEREGPARISEWSADGQFIRQWQTPQPNGNNGYAFDAQDPDHVYIGGTGHPSNAEHAWYVRFRVDWKTGTWTTDAVWPGILAGMKNGWAPHGWGYPRIVNRDGKKFLTFGRGYAVYRFDGDQLVASAAIIKDQPKGEKSPTFFIWRDRNGDGKIDESEWRDQPLPSPGVYTYWGGNWQEDLSLVNLVEGSRDVYILACEGFDEHGNPIFKEWKKLLSDPIMSAKAAGTADATHGGNEIFDRFSASWHSVLKLASGDIFTDIRGGGFSANHAQEQKLSRYVPDGQGGYRILWRIGRAANVRAGNGAIVGSIFVSPPAHNLIAVTDQTRAGAHVFTADEGLYVDTLLLEGARSHATIYGSGGEFFAGQTVLNQKDGKVYLAFGKLTPIIYEAQGWTDKTGITKLTTLPKTITLPSNQVADPPDLALQLRGGAGKARLAHFLPAAGGPPALDGSMTGWESCWPIQFGQEEKQIEVRAQYDPKTIYLRWKVRSDAAIAIKPLQPAQRLFTHDRGADTVGFYMQCDPKAQGTAAGGRPGDVRFIMGIFDDNGKIRPAALGMYPEWLRRDLTSPATFGSPQGSQAFEHVALVPEIRLQHLMDADKKGFVLSAAIPRSVLPAVLPDMEKQLRTMVNFDANFGGNQKLWWSNGDGSANRETNDEPTESRLYPGSWAQATFVDLGEGLVVRQWQAIGPFGFPKLKELDSRSGRGEIMRTFVQATFPPEQAVDLAATYKGDMTQTRKAQRTLKWEPVSIAEESVALPEALKRTGWTMYDDEGTAYLATWIRASQACEVRFEDIDGRGQHAVRGWLNGTALPIAFPQGRSAKDLAHQIDSTKPVMLKAGWNAVLVRYDFIYGDTHLGLRVHGSREALWELKVSNTPPGGVK